MKVLNMVTSRMIYVIAVGVFFLLRSILTASVILLLVLSQVGSGGFRIELFGQSGGMSSLIETILTEGNPGPEDTAAASVEFTATPQETLALPTGTLEPTDAPLTPTATLEPTPTFEPTPTQEQASFCPQSPGRVENIEYDARLFPGPLPAKVYLPPCYDVDGLSYPVLYLLSQEGSDENLWVDFGVAEAAEERIQSGELSPFMIVMPQSQESLFNQTDGGPGSYEIEVVEGLVPYIDAIYRTYPSSDQRAIGGVSRGGVWAIEIAFSNPDLFDGLAAISPSLDNNYPRLQYDPGTLANSAETLPTNILFLIAEDDPALAQVETLSQTLINLGYINSFVVELPGQDGRIWAGVPDEVFNILAAGW